MIGERLEHRESPTVALAQEYLIRHEEARRVPYTAQERFQYGAFFPDHPLCNRILGLSCSVQMCLKDEPFIHRCPLETPMRYTVLRGLCLHPP